MEEEESKELGVEGCCCSWQLAEAVAFRPGSSSTGEMTSDEEQEMSKALDRVL